MLPLKREIWGFSLPALYLISNQSTEDTTGKEIKIFPKEKIFESVHEILTLTASAYSQGSEKPAYLCSLAISFTASMHKLDDDSSIWTSSHAGHLKVFVNMPLVPKSCVLDHLILFHLNSLDPDHANCFVWPVLCPICLQIFLANHKLKKTKCCFFLPEQISTFFLYPQYSYL